jgi:hypothetical protein
MDIISQNCTDMGTPPQDCEASFRELMIQDEHRLPPPHRRLSVDGSTGWLVLNRPERRNALNAEMWAAIPPLMKSLDEQP